MEVTPWEVIATLLGLAIPAAVAMGIYLNKRIDAVAQDSADARKAIRDAMERERQEAVKRVGDIYAKMNQNEIAAHRTFATKDGVEKALDRVLAQIDRMGAELKGEIGKLRDRQQGGGGR